MSSLYDTYVVVPADKAANQIVFLFVKNLNLGV